MAYRGIPGSLKEKITDYYEHKYHTGRFFDEKQVLSELSQPIRNVSIYSPYSLSFKRKYCKFPGSKFV